MKNLTIYFLLALTLVSFSSFAENQCDYTVKKRVYNLLGPKFKEVVKEENVRFYRRDLAIYIPINHYGASGSKIVLDHTIVLKKDQNANVIPSFYKAKEHSQENLNEDHSQQGGEYLLSTKYQASGGINAIFTYKVEFNCY